MSRQLLSLFEMASNNVHPFHVIFSMPAQIIESPLAFCVQTKIPYHDVTTTL